MQTITELDPWRVTTRINQAGHLTLEVALDGQVHADVVLQPGGVIDLVTKARPKSLGEKGWAMPPSDDRRKFRFEQTDVE